MPSSAPLRDQRAAVNSAHDGLICSMLIDARSLPDGVPLETDLCIVGGGPAGLTIARALAGRGFSICMIESGGLQTDSADQERSVRDLSVGRNAGLHYFQLDDARGRGLGGSSTRWNIPMGDGIGVRLRPLDPIDFEARDWLSHSGWPFDYSHLDPYYTRAAALCGIEHSPPTVDECARRNSGKPLPLNPDMVKTAMFQLGPSSVWWNEEMLAGLRHANARVLLNGTVTQIEAESNAQKVSGVRVATLDGKTMRVTAKTVVLACGGIDNARLLLLSDEVQRGGLGNGRGLVGRYFMEHLHVAAGALLAAQLNAFEQTALYRVHKSGNTWAEGQLALADKVLRREQLRGCVFAIYPLSYKGSSRALEFPENPTTGDAAANLLLAALWRRTWAHDGGKLLREIVADPAGALRATQRSIRQKRRVARGHKPGAQGQLLGLQLMSEQEPHPDSRVLLDYRSRDAFGQPRAVLDWRITEEDMRAITRTLTLIGREFEVAGLGRFQVFLHPALPPHNLMGGRHHMGTTRMHKDAARGVVDADCRVHGIDNLYVAGSSVFPTGGYANPTLTVVALALRLAEHLARRTS